MKHHVVVKLRRPAHGGLPIPDWVTFIHDKTHLRTSLDPDVDAVLGAYGASCWVTREYRSAAGTWDPDETAHGLDRTYRLLLLAPDRLPDAALVALRALPVVEHAHQIEVAESLLPGPGTSRAASLGPSPAQRVGLPFARALTDGSPSVRVAVLDTGVDADHPELAGRVAEQADFVDLAGLDTSAFVGDHLGRDSIATDEVGHGTHVAGIISARGLRMHEGVAPRCPLMAVRVLATLREGDRLSGAGIVDNINPAIKWAVDHGADVINMSLGIRHTGGGLPHEDVIRYAMSKDVAVVAASGNDGTSERYYPGALPGVVAVGASDLQGSVAPFSSFGAPITVIAPGVDIHSSFARQGYAVASGTSQASPLVAGCIALLLSYARDHGRGLGLADVVGILRATSDKVDARLRDQHAGYGLVNMTDAFKLLLHTLT